MRVFLLVLLGIAVTAASAFVASALWVKDVVGLG